MRITPEMSLAGLRAYVRVIRVRGWHQGSYVAVDHPAPYGEQPVCASHACRVAAAQVLSDQNSSDQNSRETGFALFADLCDRLVEAARARNRQARDWMDLTEINDQVWRTADDALEAGRLAIQGAEREIGGRS